MDAPSTRKSEGVDHFVFKANVAFAFHLQAQFCQAEQFMHPLAVPRSMRHGLIVEPCLIFSLIQKCDAGVYHIYIYILLLMNK